ncbi:MAG: AraC family transcriptional regulator [Anaerolineales bacterium]|nr:AraC family transcriptional regulator [Anaerolineales bacterium]
MDQIDGMGKALDFIEANLKREICVADIAAAVGYSLYHFCRTFNAIVQHTPYDYLMCRRLSEAARELLVTDRKMIDLAIDYQFNNPETFSRAFKRMFGTQPSQWKQDSRLDPHALLPPLTRAHLQAWGEFNPQLVEKPALQLVGLVTRIGLEPRVGGAVLPDLSAVAGLWQTLAAELDSLQVAPQPGALYGLLSYPADWARQGAFYLAALEIETRRDLPASFVFRDLPASQYVRFKHPGSPTHLDLTWDYIYATWLPKSEFEQAQPAELHYLGQDITRLLAGTGELDLLIPLK